MTNDDTVAMQFIGQHRNLFQIPDDIDFKLLPRFQSYKKVGRSMQNALFIKVSRAKRRPAWA